MLADYLVVDVTKPYAEQGSFFEIERAAREGRAHETCGGRALNDDVMDTIFTLLVNAGNGPVIRDGVDQATTAGVAHAFPTWRRRTRIRPSLPSTTDDGRPVDTLTAAERISLELDDIQSGALHERPSPYVGRYLLLRIDDRRAGRRAGAAAAPVGRLGPALGRSGARRLDHGRLHLSRSRRRSACRRTRSTASRRSSGRGWRRARPSWATSARAAPSTGRSRSVRRTSTSRWRRCRPTPSGWRRSSSGHAERTSELPGVEVIWRQDCYQLPTGRTSFGFKDGIGQPAVEGAASPARTRGSGRSRPARSSSATRTRPASCRRCRRPEVLGRNGTYVVFRKLHTRVAAYRQYLRAKAASREEEALLGAKMVGRWQSGAPLALAPEQRRPRARRRPEAQQRLPLRRRSAWLQVPGRRARASRQPARRARRRRKRQRPPPPDDPARHELRPDAARRACSRTTALTGASSSSSPARTSKRQFEFVKTQWLNDGIFIGAPAESDPLVGAERRLRQRSRSRSGPIRRRLQEPAAVRRHPRRRVLLRPGPAGAALAGGARRPDRREEEDVATTPTGTDRWKALDFGPPPSGSRPSPTSPCSSSTSRTGASRVITLNRPHADNAITTEMGARLTEILETIAVRPAVRVVIITGAGDARVLRRQRPAPAQGHDQGGLAAPASGLRSHALHAARSCASRSSPPSTGSPTAAARDRPEHRLHHRLRERDLRPARGDDRPRGRRRLTGSSSAPAPAGQGAADADDRRPDQRAGGLPAGDGQRALPAGRADGRRAAGSRRRSRATRRRRCRRSSGPFAWARGSRSSRRSRS